MVPGLYIKYLGGLLQVDLGAQKQVTGIITQGARDFGHVQYVAAYKVAHSNDGRNWTEYRDPGAVDSKVCIHCGGTKGRSGIWGSS